MAINSIGVNCKTKKKRNFFGFFGLNCVVLGCFVIDFHFLVLIWVAEEEDAVEGV